MALVRLSSEHAARSLLQRLLNAGRATIEQFDQPPPGHLNPSCYRNLARAPEAPETVQISALCCWAAFAGGHSWRLAGAGLSLRVPCGGA